MEEIKVNFKYTEEEAGIVARCEMGVGNLPYTMSVSLIGAICIVVIIRIIRKMPLPSMDIIGCYIVALAAWILFMVYIAKRLKQNAKELVKRELYLCRTADELDVYEFTTELRYHCRLDNISKVERGDRICRITSSYGRICLPLRLLSAEELGQLDRLENACHVRKNWM